MVRTGYYNNGEETGKVFKNGWYHTGDLGVYDDKQNLKIIGRKKYQQKLKNGFEYDPEYLEIEFESCLEGIMKQIYIYGQENYDFLIAIVIPRTEKSEFKKENLKQD